MIKRALRHWRVKVGVQRLFSCLPGSLGYYLNEKATRFIRGPRVEIVRSADRLDYRIPNLAKIPEKTGWNFGGKCILEMGSGWHGLDLILFYLLGARKTITIDQHRNLTLDVMLSHLPAISQAKSIDLLSQIEPADQVAQRWQRLEKGAADCGRLEDLLDLLRVDYRIAKSASPIGLRIPPGSVDLYYSHSVLQRVAERDLRKIVDYISNVLFNDNSAFFHNMHLSDIHGMEHCDDKLWRLRYLKYSDPFFKIFYNSRLASQNRLRTSDIVDMFTAVGLQITYLESYCKARDLEKIRSLRVAKRFRSKEDLDLATTHAFIYGVKSEDARRNPVVERNQMVTDAFQDGP